MLKEIVIKAMNGDEESFNSLIQQRKESIYRIAYSYVNNPDDALDIVQEAVYKAFVSIKKLKQPQYFNTWLTRITINCAIDYIRKKKRLVYMEEEESFAVQDEASSPEDKMDLYEALQHLDHKYKSVIILRYFEDLKMQEIADVLDLPLNTVKTRIHRALSQLKIGMEGVDELG